MPWLVLIFSAVCEAVWATALGFSEGLTKPVSTTIFVTGLALSMVGLGWAVKHIPIGTAYAVWVGLGAALTVTYAMVTGAEPFTVWKSMFLFGIIGAAIGLKLAPSSGAIVRPIRSDPESPS